MTAAFLELYEAMDVVGNGSFGVIRKVRRKTDGVIFARKELNFERMSERDKKQIVAEVNILKDLHHDHIVRYHDRSVDRDAGTLYIIMEFCGGGDLSSVIKQAIKHNRPIAEDAIWNYFMQILLALNHCHNTGGHGRTSSAGSTGDMENREKRAQILHRDLKPDNVFLDESNTVKLGDFGLSKALSQAASFANTYVGTPYYMSPELMQEKAYDSKSDIWSLGCLIYELCALKPPFHEAKTLSELSILIRSGRIPPLPRNYSQSLSSIIKSMLNVNPAMRPSAAQLLQHERIEFAHKVSETEKLLNTIKTHRSNLTAKERDLCTRESALKEQEAHIAEAIQQRDGQIHLLQTQLHECHMDMNSRPNVSDVNTAVKQREEELRVLVLKREEEVSQSMQRREDEIMEAIRRREAEVLDAWSKREEVLREEFRLALAQELEARSGMFEERESDLLRREAAMKEDEERVDSAKRLLEEKVKALDEQMANLSASKKDRSPLDEVQNILSRAAQQVTPKVSAASKPSMKNQTPCPVIVTPLQRSSTHKLKELFQPSAMKGVVLTNTGEVLTTPSPAELAKMFDLSRRFEDEVMASPKVGLNFAQVFDGDKKDAGRGLVQKLRETALESESEAEDEERETIRRTTQVRRRRESGADVNGEGSAPPTRLRRPSIRTSGRRSLVPSTVSDSEIATTSASTTQSKPKARPLPHPHLAATGSTAFPTRSNTAPTYDMDDDENLPSPFLKRTERVAAAAGSAAASVGAGAARKPLTKRPSGGNFLRVVAAVNSSATKRGTSVVRA